MFIDIKMDNNIFNFVFTYYNTLFFRYKLKGNIPGPIESKSYKASFSLDTHVLEVAMKANS